MANIVENLRKILTSRYGRDVRQAIHDSISDINDIAESQEAAILAHTREAEAWAKGTKDGADVPSTDPTYHDNAKYYSGIGDNFRKLAEAWAKGTVDSVDVESGQDGYHDNAEYYKTLAEYAMDQAEHFYQETLTIAQRLGNALVPKGTVTFANLPSVSNPAILDGFMYNISDSFTTTSDFVEGAGENIPAGANVYKITVNDVSKWDLLPGTGATIFNGTQQVVAEALAQGLLSEGMLVNIWDDDADGEAVTALQVEYDDTNTGLDETTAQGAIEKLKTMIAGLITDLGGKIDTDDIVDNVTTNDSTKPLSAKQGKTLADTKLNKTNKDDYDFRWSDTNATIAQHIPYVHQQMQALGYEGFKKFIIWTSEGTFQSICYTYSQWTAGILIEVGGIRQFTYATNGNNYTNIKYALGNLDVINNLTTNSADRPLSAAQGKVLSEAKMNRAGDTMSGQLNVPGVLFTNGYQIWRLNGTQWGSITCEAGGENPVTLRNDVGSITIVTDAYAANMRLCVPDNGNIMLMGAAINCGNRAWSAGIPIYAGSYQQFSSRLIKENVKSLTKDDAKKILDLRPVSFDFKKKFGGQKNCIGLIAEEALNVIPEIVNVPEGYNEEDFDPDQGLNNKILTVDYVKLTPYLVKLCQSQQNEIDRLNDSLKSLRDEINEIKSQLTS